MHYEVVWPGGDLLGIFPTYSAAWTRALSPAPGGLAPPRKGYRVSPRPEGRGVAVGRGVGLIQASRRLRHMACPSRGDGCAYGGLGAWGDSLFRLVSMYVRNN